MKLLLGKVRNGLPMRPVSLGRLKRQGKEKFLRGYSDFVNLRSNWAVSGEGTRHMLSGQWNF